MPTPLPDPVDALLKPLRDFLRLEAAGGIALIIAAVLAMLIANSPLAGHYNAFLDLSFEVRIGTVGLAKPLLLWINDGLMAVFFFLVGMELKREVLEGHLSSIRRASLPAVAAVGGMLVPAGIFALFNLSDAEAMRGWAIPTATDIAFALGVLSLLGNRIPSALKAFLLSVAIFDDLGAIIVIAVFYTADLALPSLAVGGTVVLGLGILNRLDIRRPMAYIALGIPLWIAVLKSGVHATLAGVVLAMFIPLRSGSADGDRSSSILHQLVDSLHPWVAFGVLPIFAFANAGVRVIDLSLPDLWHPIPLGIVAGLFLGKQIGVMLFSWVAVRLRLASKPDRVSWRHLHGVTLLCGIGFTMSLFIASLAYEQGSQSYLGLERLGILIGSLASGLFGYLLLASTIGKRSDPA